MYTIIYYRTEDGVYWKTLNNKITGSSRFAPLGEETIITTTYKKLDKILGIED